MFIMQGCPHPDSRDRAYSLPCGVLHGASVQWLEGKPTAGPTGVAAARSGTGSVSGTSWQAMALTVGQGVSGGCLKDRC